MKNFLGAGFIATSMFLGFAFSSKEYARVASPDGKHVAIAKYRTYQAWLPMAPGDSGGKSGWIVIATKETTVIGAAPVGRIWQIHELRWKPDSVELPLVAIIKL
jgi:hypothetical protein